MSATVNLGVSYITAAQDQKEVTANAAFDRLDKALTETFDADVTSGNVTLTSTQYREALLIRAINATTAGRTVTLPQVERIMLAQNVAANTQSVGFVRGTATVSLAPGETALLRTDGTLNGLVALVRWSDVIGYRSGSFIGERGSSIATSQAVVADTIYAHPVRIRAPVTIDQLAMRIGTGVGSTNGKMGVYAHAGTAPGALIAACSGTVDMSGSGPVTDSFSSNPTLLPGIVWFAAIFDGAAQPCTYNANSSDPQFLSELMGGATSDWVASATAAGRTMRVTASGTYASGLPASFGSPTFGTGFPGAPVITARVL